MSEIYYTWLFKKIKQEFLVTYTQEDLLILQNSFLLQSNGLKEKVFQQRKTFNIETLAEHTSQSIKAGKTQYRKCYSKTYSNYIS